MIARSDKLVALGIFVAVTSVTLALSPRQGIHRDEAYYMDAGEQYVTYLEHVVQGKAERPLSDATIRRYWDYNHEHPPLLKLLYGVSWRLLHQCDCAADARYHPGLSRITEGKHVTLPLLSEVAAFRLPTMAFFGLLCALVYLFFVEALGSRTGGLAAALLMFAQPRAFFHAQTASFDLPAATLWLATTYAYWRAVKTGSTRRALLVGVLYGLFLATKLQSFFLPVALGAHWLWLLFRRHRTQGERPSLKPLVAMATVGPALFLGLWPWLWHDTVSRLQGYLGFHWNHVHYNFEYLGTNYNRPPYPVTEPLGMLLYTAPVVLLAAAAAGIVLLSRQGLAELRGTERRDPLCTKALLLLAGLLPIALFFRGTVPIFGATKHWLGTMPFLALAAGVALDRLGRNLVAELVLEARPALRNAVLATLVAVAFAPAAVETLRSHPYGLSHYNALAGGAPGGADLGMNRQFWGYSVKGVLPWLNGALPQSARLYLHDWNHDAYQLYLRQGELRPDIRDAGMETSPPSPDSRIPPSDAALVVHEKHFNKYDYMIWTAFGHVQPAYVLTLDGVPLVSVYLR